MSEWWTYTLSDFLMFSPRVYYRLFEAMNGALWPAQLLTLGIGLAMLVLLARPAPQTGRAVAAVLGLIWIVVAWTFFWERYANINWAAVYVAPAFALQGLLLIGIGAFGDRLHFAQYPDGAGRAALGLFAIALMLYPGLAPVMDRSWLAAEIFGIAPDPTAIATLAVLAVAGGRMRWLLMLIPALWCIIAGATLWTMGAPEFFVPPAAALTALLLAAFRSAPR